MENESTPAERRCSEDPRGKNWVLVDAGVLLTGHGANAAVNRQ